MNKGTRMESTKKVCQGCDFIFISLLLVSCLGNLKQFNKTSM